MGTVTNLTQQQVENIQIDEGVIFLDYGETTERLLAPTRGGGEFNASVTVRDIEFDGKNGKTAGTQIIEAQAASLKVNSLCMSQNDLALAIPNCSITGTGSAAVIKNPKSGVIPISAYLKNVTMFAKLLGGAFKKIVIYNAMHETGFTAKAVQKSEGELGLEFQAHYTTADLDGDLWEVKEVAAYKAPQFMSAATSTTGTKVIITFNHEMAAAGLISTDFAVEESDAAKIISSAAIGSDAHTVELTLSASVTKGNTLNVSYTKGTLANTSGVLADTFTEKPVTNNKA